MRRLRLCRCGGISNDKHLIISPAGNDKKVSVHYVFPPEKWMRRLRLCRCGGISNDKHLIISPAGDDGKVSVHYVFPPEKWMRRLRLCRCGGISNDKHLIISPAGDDGKVSVHYVFPPEKWMRRLRLCRCGGISNDKHLIISPAGDDGKVSVHYVFPPEKWMLKMVHVYSLLGYQIAVDVNSGSVHLLDDISYKILNWQNEPMSPNCPVALYDEISGYDKEQITEAWNELYQLQEAGQLFAEDDYLSFEKILYDGAPVKALCLHVAHDCNMRCQYCFASTGDFGHGRKLMDADTAKRAIDFVIKTSGKRKNIEIDFFGGEPLMAFDTVRQTIDYARSLEQDTGKRFRFTITTNGLALDKEVIRYINENMNNVVLSLDGRPEVNDKNRKTVNGKGTYELVVPQFQEVTAARDKESKDYFVRGTFTRDNLDFSEDVLHMAELGFKHLSVEPVSAENAAAYSLREEDLPEIFAEYNRLAQIMLDAHEFEFFHFNIDLSQGPCVIKRLRGCGAGYEYVAITPEGDIYPCHQFVGMDEYKMGNLSDGKLDMDISRKFASMNIYTRNACGQCWAKFYCSGGCSASNITVNGNIETPNETACRMERKRLECAIMLQVAQKLKIMK